MNYIYIFFYWRNQFFSGYFEMKKQLVPSMKLKYKYNLSNPLLFLYNFKIKNSVKNVVLQFTLSFSGNWKFYFILVGFFFPLIVMSFLEVIIGSLTVLYYEMRSRGKWPILIYRQTLPKDFERFERTCRSIFN